MKLPKLKKGHLYYIKWIDAVSPADNSWHNENDLDPYKKEYDITKDVGFFLFEDKMTVFIAGGCSFEGSAFFNKNYHRELQIPKGCIIKIKDLTRHI